MVATQHAMCNATNDVPASLSNNDGIWDLSDIGLFISNFNAGCP